MLKGSFSILEALEHLFAPQLLLVNLNKNHRSWTASNNLYYTGQPGKIYNQASGLGTINFAKLNAKFNSEGTAN